VACHEAVAAGNCRLMASNWSANQKQPGMIFSLGLIRKHVEGGRAAAVTAALKALRLYDTKGRVGLYSDHILTPWIAAVAMDPAFAKVDLAAVLTRRDPFHVIDSADRLAGGRATTVQRAEAFATLIRMVMRDAAVAA